MINHSIDSWLVPCHSSFVVIYVDFLQQPNRDHSRIIEIATPTQQSVSAVVVRKNSKLGWVDVYNNENNSRGQKTNKTNSKNKYLTASNLVLDRNSKHGNKKEKGSNEFMEDRTEASMETVVSPVSGWYAITVRSAARRWLCWMRNTKYCFTCHSKSSTCYQQKHKWWWS